MDLIFNKCKMGMDLVRENENWTQFKIYQKDKIEYINLSVILSVAQDEFNNKIVISDMINEVKME